jgi:hypothetical protein
MKENIVENIEEDIIKSTKEGRLYKTTQDFFSQKKVINLIEDLLKSDLIKQIDENKRKAQAAS